MNLASVVVAFYGFFTLVGGVIGYVKAKSTASLIAGLTSGLVLLACAYGITKGGRAPLAVAALVSLLLGGRFIGTWLTHHRLMPDLLMIVFSSLSLAAILFVWLKR